MAQATFGLFPWFYAPLIARSSRLFRYAALSAGILACGASILNAGRAIAFETCPIGYSAPNPAPGTGTFGIGNMLETPALPVGTTCSLTSTIANTVAFNVALPPSQLGPLSGDYGIRMVATDGNFFYGAGIDSSIRSPGGITVRKQIYSDRFFSDLIWDQTSIDGGSVGLTPFIGGGLYGDIYVRDTYTIPSGTSLNSVTNTFYQTPGPLGVLGAAATFGFGRKLRSRIRQGRQA